MNFLAPLVAAPDDVHTLRHERTGQILAFTLEAAFDSRRRRRGLLGRDGLDRGAALVIAPCSSIHTFFMRFPIDVLFVRRDGVVAKVCRSVPPWRIVFGPGALAAIEFAAGTVDAAGLAEGDVVAIAGRICP